MKANSLFITSLLLFSIALPSIIFSSCGTRTDSKNTDIDTVQHPLATEDGIGHDEARTFPAQEIDFNGKHYIINISVAPNDTLPIVKDSYGDPYYDNEVKVKVTAEGVVVIDKTFVKADFTRAVSDLHAEKLVLGGMAFNTINNSCIQFGAQLNEPGDIEGGIAFKVSIPTIGGQAQIVRDTTIDEENFTD